MLLGSPMYTAFTIAKLLPRVRQRRKVTATKRAHPNCHALLTRLVIMLVIRLVIFNLMFLVARITTLATPLGKNLTTAVNTCRMNHIGS
jgi:hypothetical protein